MGLSCALCPRVTSFFPFTEARLFEMVSFWGFFSYALRHGIHLITGSIGLVQFQSLLYERV